MVDNDTQEIELRGIFKFDNESQFLTHTKKHIDNVQVLALNMLEEMKAMIKEDPSLSESFGIPKGENLNNFTHNFKKMIKIHDISKTNESPDFLIKHDLNEPIYKILSDFAGTKLEDGDRVLVNKLNDIDKKETIDLAKQLGLKKWELDLYETLEHSADIVERGCNPITSVEMNKSVKLASEISRLRPEPDQKLILSAEKFYRENIYDNQLEFAQSLLSKVDKSPSLAMEEMRTSIRQEVESSKTKVINHNNPSRSNALKR